MYKYLLMLVAVLTIVGSLPIQAAPTKRAYVDARVTRALQLNDSVPVLIVFEQQLDTSFARGFPSKLDKGTAVVEALRAQAAGDQQRFLDYFKSQGQSARGFFSLNAISVEINQPTLNWLMVQPEIAAIHEDAPRNMLAPTLPAESVVERPDAVDVVETGVQEIGAPQVWDAGYTGQGIVVAGEDTGVRWSHDSLKPNYRGWDVISQTVDHDYNWHDGVEAVTNSPCGTPWKEAPCDDNSHGTHTVGTIVGDDGQDNQIGVAPGAEWIACRNMNAGNGTIATYLSCIDWMLAPYPTNGTTAQGDPTKAPHIINNSWSCPPSEGCSGDTIDDMQPAIQNLLNAGILFVGSAGNEGSSCATIQSPPALYPENFIVGAYNPSTGLIASFSSRGPVTYQNETRIGPNLSAPGTSTRSATNSGDSAYSLKSGTSMAAPHVAGVAALLWSARPELQGNVWLTRQILQETARPTPSTETCGGVLGTAIPNNTFGHGKVDAWAAIQPTFDGSVLINGEAPLSATLILTSQATSETLSLVVETDGTWETTLPSGDYLVRFEWNNQTYHADPLNLPAGELTTRNYSFDDTSVEYILYLPMVRR